MQLEMDVRLTQGAFLLDAQVDFSAMSAGIFGPSGAGKSTILHLISGLKRPDRGRVVLNGRVLCDIERGIFVKPEQRRVGVVFQELRLFPHMRVRENLTFGSRRRGARVRLDAVIETLQLEALLDRHPQRLSGGERQRVALGRAILASPEVLLLDEPFSAIDVVRRVALMPFISRIRREFDLPLVLISHYLPDILRLTDQLVLVDDGEVVGSGRCSELAFDARCAHLLLEAGPQSTFGARVESVEPRDGTGRLVVESSPGRQPTRLIVARKDDAPPDSPVRVQIRPEDVTLSFAPAEFITAQNQLRGHIMRMAHFEGRTLVELDVGFPLLAEITPKAAREFEVTVGMKVWAIFKSWAVDYSSDVASDEGCPQPRENGGKHPLAGSLFSPLAALGRSGR